MSNPYAAPDADIRTPGDEGEYQPRMFSLDGRIGRLRYLAWGFLLNIIAYIPMMLLMAVIVPNVAEESQSSMALVTTIPLLVLMIGISYVLSRRRLHDLNRSSWLFVLLFIPLVNIAVSLYLLFWPGTPGSNQYGLPPTKNNSALWIILVVALIVMLGIVAAVALPAYQDYIKAAADAAS